MADDCETSLAEYDKANRDVKEQYDEMILWAQAAGVSIVVLLAVLAGIIALVGTAVAEAATVAFIPVAVLQVIAAALLALVGIIGAVSLLASFVAVIKNYMEWESAKSARASAMSDIRAHCPQSQWPAPP